MVENRGRTTAVKRKAFRVESIMDCKLKTKSGLTLTEMAVVIAVMALLFGLGLPAVRVFLDSFESRSAGMNMISAALSSARAIAAKEQRYAGLRFQRDRSGRTYMIFIVNSPITIQTRRAPFQLYPMPYRYLAIKGIQPMKLPDILGIFGGDLDVNADTFITNDDFYDENKNIEVQKIKYLSTFTILFSPQGKLVRKYYMVLPNEDTSDGEYDPLYAGDVFSGQTLPESGLPLEADDYHIGSSRLSMNSLYIFDQREFENVEPQFRYDKLVANLHPFYINPYLGTIIQTD